MGDGGCEVAEEGERGDGVPNGERAEGGDECVLTA